MEIFIRVFKRRIRCCGNVQKVLYIENLREYRENRTIIREIIETV